MKKLGNWKIGKPKKEKKEGKQKNKDKRKERIKETMRWNTIIT